MICSTSAIATEGTYSRSLFYLPSLLFHNLIKPTASGNRLLDRNGHRPFRHPARGAAVNVVNVEKGVTVSTLTNQSGHYSQMQLVPGSYQITIEVQGFKRFLQDNVSIDVGRSTAWTHNSNSGWLQMRLP